MDPRLKAIYLAAIAVGVFFLPRWWMVAAVLGIQLVLWFAVRLSVGQLVRQVSKLALFLAVIQIAYSLVTNDPATDRWQTLDLLSFEIDVNVTGAVYGFTMVLRVLTVVITSQVVRAGDPRALAAGLGKLGVPKVAALSIDAVLVLLGSRGKGGGGRGKGGGRHGGGGRGKGEREGADTPAGFWASLKRLARGDVGAIVDMLRTQQMRVQQHLDEVDPEGSEAFKKDVAVIAAIALTMLGIKMLKLLPGLPFAPGHKGVILIPLYFVAGFTTRSRAGSTLTGLTFGAVAFLLGDGRYGVFEIAKHVAPGVLVDLFGPLLRVGGKTRGILWWAGLGLVVALGRFATITAIALVVQAPALVYAFLLPGLAIHATFGVLSGLVSAPLMRALTRRGMLDGSLGP